ncbi:unnamed protein product [Peronospora belbahrii]|uniref:Uncharacterized protein n=1 Tax=Peronospora belbahrii TaxID=622444 RepID=A0ABN8CKP4_9STRA|nr:unnamed protein product [Peronospora belbahrii]
MYDSIKLAKKLPQMSGSDLEPINLDETSADRLISKLLNWLVRNKQQSYYKNAIQGKGTESAKSKEPAKTKESKKRKSMESAETKESKKRKSKEPAESKESKKRKSKESAETKESKKRSKQTFEKGSF